MGVWIRVTFAGSNGEGLVFMGSGGFHAAVTQDNGKVVLMRDETPPCPTEQTLDEIEARIRAAHGVTTQ